MNNFTIGIVCGGTSKERGISLNSARSIADNVESDKIKIKIFYINENNNYFIIDRKQLYSNTPSDFDFKINQNSNCLNLENFILELKKVTIVFPIIHGVFGEDGQLQKILEDNNIPFVGSGSKSCKLGFSKEKATKFLKENGFYTYPFVCFKKYSKNDEEIIKRFFELNKLKKAVVKPTNGGSSIGVFCLYSYEEAIEKTKYLFKNNLGPVMIEPFCVGREFTIIILQNLKTRKPVALLPSEIDIKYMNYQIFDYRKKYLPTTQTRYYTPARFTNEEIEKIQHHTEDLFRLFNFKDLVRIDGWLLNDGRIWFSDINIAAGMEQNSFVFQQSTKIGLSHVGLIKYLIKSSYLKYKMNFPIDDNYQKNKKKNVFVLFGGDNAERQVSLMSGTNVWLKLLKSKKYLPTPFLIDKNDNIWQLPYELALNHTVEEIAEHCNEIYNNNNNNTQEIVNKICQKLEINNYLLDKPKKYSFDEFIKLAKNEKAFVFLGLHGGKGEDGTIQKKLSENNILFNGSDENGSKLCMDKYQTGEIIKKLNDNTLITCPKIKFQLKDFDNFNTEKYEKFWKDTVKSLNIDDFIIKPAQDGSSAGAVRIYDCKDLQNYIEILQQRLQYIPANTFKNQNNIVEMPSNNEQPFLLEGFIETDNICVKNNQINYKQNKGWLEFTVGVLEKNGIYHSFNPSITIAENKILSIEEKFQGGTGINITPPPFNIINEKLNDLIKQNIEKAAKALSIKNYARLDIFVNTLTHKIILIEANTLPALTPSTVIFHQALEEKNSLNPLDFLELIIETKN